MKWLILLALISCGQKNPPARDVADSDGDQIPNYLESNSELEKYVAEVIPFSKTEGTISFKLDGKYESVNISNEHDIAGNAMRLLTKTLSTLRSADHFSEWSLLKPQTNSYIIPDGKYVVLLSLETNDKPDFITLSDGKAEIDVGAFSSRMEFTLSADELRQILAGKLHLNLKRSSAENPYSVESTIRERTYRVFYFDGRISRIHYVSHELDFKRYLRLSGIRESFELNSFAGFSQNNPKSYWWTRNAGEKDKIVVKSSLKELSEFHASNFNLNTGSVDRSNGYSVGEFSVKKHPSLKYVMKLRGTKVNNIIKESTRSYHIGGQAQDDCRQWIRSVASRNTTVITKNDLLANLIIRTKEKSGSLNEFQGYLTEGSDKDGWYLELAMDETPEEFTILLNTRPQNTFVMTGVYRDECKPANSLVSTNDEGQMNLKIESFIEKID